MYGVQVHPLRADLIADAIVNIHSQDVCSCHDYLTSRLGRTSRIVRAAVAQAVRSAAFKSVGSLSAAYPLGSVPPAQPGFAPLLSLACGFVAVLMRRLI